MHQDPHPHQHPETAEEMAAMLAAQQIPPVLPVPPDQLVLLEDPEAPALPVPPARLAVRGPQDLPGLAIQRIQADQIAPATPALATTPGKDTGKEAAKTRNDE